MIKRHTARLMASCFYKAHLRFDYNKLAAQIATAIKVIHQQEEPTFIGVTILCSSLYMAFLPGDNSSLPCRESNIAVGMHALLGCFEGTAKTSRGVLESVAQLA